MISSLTFARKIMNCLLLPRFDVLYIKSSYEFHASIKKGRFMVISLKITQQRLLDAHVCIYNRMMIYCKYDSCIYFVTIIKTKSGFCS